MKKLFYETPSIDVLEIGVEQGFAVSGDFEDGMEEPGTWD